MSTSPVFTFAALQTAKYEPFFFALFRISIKVVDYIIMVWPDTQEEKERGTEK